ncbi:MAG: ActD-like protein [Myxococcales bacterium]|nr:ActD-like protein [Myxococcales bacterium]
MTTRDERRTPDLLVEQLAQGALPPAEAEATRRRLLAEPDGARRLADLAADDAAVFARHPAPAVAAEIQRRLGRRRRATWAVALPLAAAAGAAAVLAIGPAPTLTAATAQDAGERAKGPLTPGLGIHRQVAAAAGEALADGDGVRAGDVLQLTYAARGAGHGVLFSIDGRGAVTLHFPDEADGDTALPAGQQIVALPHAYQLDDAPRFERFFFITAHHPLDVGELLAEARRLAADDAAEDAAPALPTDVAWTDLLLRKPQ